MRHVFPVTQVNKTDTQIGANVTYRQSDANTILMENGTQIASKLIKESKEHICGEQLLCCLWLAYSMRITQRWEGWGVGQCSPWAAGHQNQKYKIKICWRLEQRRRRAVRWVVAQFSFRWELFYWIINYCLNGQCQKIFDQQTVFSSTGLNYL
jgi:hypothetical protein